MPFEDLGKCVSFLAAADLSGSQFCFVAVNSAGKVVLAGDGWECDGILQNDPALGEVATVMVGTGISKIKCGAQTTKGSYVASGSSAGTAVNAATGDHVAGLMLEAASTDEIGTIFFKPRSAKLVAA